MSKSLFRAILTVRAIGSDKPDGPLARLALKTPLGGGFEGHLATPLLGGVAIVAISSPSTFVEGLETVKNAPLERF